MTIELIDTAESEWHILPSLIVCLGRCEHEECKAIHAVRIVAQWLCFGGFPGALNQAAREARADVVVSHGCC